MKKIKINISVRIRNFLFYCRWLHFLLPFRSQLDWRFSKISGMSTASMKKAEDPHLMGNFSKANQQQKSQLGTRKKRKSADKTKKNIYENEKCPVCNDKVCWKKFQINLVVLIVWICCCCFFLSNLRKIKHKRLVLVTTSLTPLVI